MRHLITACMAMLLFHYTHAQEFGGNPPSHKWRQINNDTVRVIFPEGMDSIGQRVANTVMYINRHNRLSIGGKQEKMSIVLQNQTLQANGYVQLAPFRSEFYLAPPPNSNDMGAMSWVDQLSIHEYRHVLQNTNFNVGISKVVGIIGGELGQTAATNIAVPNWYWEGDAVLSETALSEQGRGRLPAFFDGFRALSLAEKDYSYMKIRNGSLKDYVPSHYPLGYIMSSYGRYEHGTTFWKDVTDDAVRYRGVIYPFSHSLKRRTGKNVAGFYNAGINWYRQQWERDVQQSGAFDDTAMISPDVRTVTDYKYVYTTTNGDLLVLKSSYKKIAGFYRIDKNGHEERLFAPGFGFDDYFGYRNERMVWTETRYHPRWTWKDYSVVMIHEAGNTRQLTLKTRYFSPDISADGKLVCAVSSSPDMHYNLDVLDAATGEVYKQLPNPQNWYYTYPKFTDDGQSVVAGVRGPDGRIALIKQSIATGESTFLLPWDRHVLGIPSLQGDTILLTANYGNVDNVYAVTADGVHQVTNARNGVQHMAVSDGQLVFSEFTAKGYKLFRTPLQFRKVQASQSAWLRPDFKEGGSIIGRVPQTNNPVTKYSQLHGMFNLHSWVPVFSDPDFSVTAYSDNILNTVTASASYNYNRNEGSSQISADILSGALFPYLSTGAAYTFNRSLYVNDSIEVFWREADWHAGISVPLQLSRGLYGRALTIGGTYTYKQRIKNASSKYMFRDTELQYVTGTLSFVNQRIKARQQINSRFAQSVYLQYRRSVNAVHAWQFMGRADLYLPGLFPTHSLVLQGAYQQRDTSLRYAFNDNFAYARGYNEPFYERVYKLGANYHFPIAYPDWGFGHMLYFMRIRGNVFYDHSIARTLWSLRNTRYASTGGELYFDTKVGNSIPFTFGLRYSYLLDIDPQDPGRQHYFQLILPLQQLFAY
ncbi:hypothetical protein MKQ68_03950 [Chitinophaga horti]|uniref:Uncharacterized protein n=1 Tax=Chitinophaga horti TaxID=2920382 RepID=A0ABY6J3S7_9BACT|nr:hypothetical protein [Chitinophaga horti]UYQ94243.1 hypothetical protein MKQ68_03950 [Chitinophaga horti]